MKKILFAIFPLFLGLSALADEVPYATALSVAKQFMETEDLTLEWDGSGLQDGTAGAPAFYVFNVKGGGWVIVSGEDCATPILAYNDTGAFKHEGMPSNLRWWMGSMQKDILQARIDGVKATEAVRDRWANPARIKTRAGGKVQLTTAKWDQGSPYNNYLKNYVFTSKTATSGVNNLATGCVATAMAITLRYHKWPEHGTGTIPSYTTYSNNYYVSGANIEDHVYDWDNMPLTYYSSTTAQKNAVAQLMADCGMMVEMDYGNLYSGGSGAASEAIVPALTAYMGYSKSAVLRYRQYYTAEEWMRMIVDDIDNCGPILYSGTDVGSSGQDAGHQFVCDGYDTAEGKISINWGWSGDSDGFFTLTLAMGQYTFDSGQSAVFGLVPDKDGSSTEADPELMMGASGNTGGLKLDSGSFATGKTFTLSANYLWNYGNSSHTWSYKAVLVDKNGAWKEDLSSTRNLSIGAYSGSRISSLSCSVKSTLALGDRVAIWYKKGNDWVPVSYDRSDIAHIWEYAYVDACFIKVPENCSAGDRYYFTLIQGNKGISSLTWYYDGSATSADSVKLTAGTHTVSADITFTDGSTETITQKIVVK